MLRVVLRARLTRPWWRRRFAAFGAGSILHRPDWVYGPHKIEIGERVLILPHLWLSAERPAWERDGPAITIGSGTAIRPYCTISAAERVEIGEDCLIAAFTSIYDSDHTMDGSSRQPLHNPLQVEPVSIGAGTWIGERVAILRGSRIGEGCVIGANSVVRGEIPPHSLAVGAPARVVRSLS